MPQQLIFITPYSALSSVWLATFSGSDIHCDVRASYIYQRKHFCHDIVMDDVIFSCSVNLFVKKTADRKLISVCNTET